MSPKVLRIRREVQEGSYFVDPVQIAEAMLERALDPHRAKNNGFDPRERIVEMHARRRARESGVHQIAE